MKERILNIETVHQCNCCLGCKTLHPLVSVIDLSKTNLEQQIIKFDFYTILMMEGEIDDILYGRKYYDYSNASLVFLTPGESIKINKSKAHPAEKPRMRPMYSGREKERQKFVCRSAPQRPKKNKAGMR